MAIEIATLAGGCFWCVEAVFQERKGVTSVVSGYTGGSLANPTYQQICTGTTGHAEAIQVQFDAKSLTFSQLLELFFRAHDPTTLNRQGGDRGSQYRSAIFYHDENQRLAAETAKNSAAELWEDPIVTEISPLTVFYAAEENHQNYYRQNSDAGYCRAVIAPKLAKLHSS